MLCAKVWACAWVPDPQHPVHPPALAAPAASAHPPLPKRVRPVGTRVYTTPSRWPTSAPTRPAVSTAVGCYVPPPWCTGLPVHSYPTSSPNHDGLLYHTTFLLPVAPSSRLPRGERLTTPPSTKHHMNQPQGRRAGKTLSSCSIDAPHPIAAGDPGE